MLYYHNSSHTSGINLAEHPSTIIFKKEYGWQRTHSINNNQLHSLAIRIDNKPNLLTKYMEVVETVKCKVLDKHILVSCLPTNLSKMVLTCKGINENTKFELTAESSAYIFNTQSGTFSINPIKSKNELPVNIKTKNIRQKIKQKMIKHYPDTDNFSFCGFLPKWEVEKEGIIML